MEIINKVRILIFIYIKIICGIFCQFCSTITQYMYIDMPYIVISVFFINSSLVLLWIFTTVNRYVTLNSHKSASYWQWHVYYMLCKILSRLSTYSWWQNSGWPEPSSHRLTASCPDSTSLYHRPSYRCLMSLNW